jgi:mRNA interferase MazF
MTLRGDLVTVSLQGAYGKPRPALIIQTDLLFELESVILCPITSDIVVADFRITLEPSTLNGLRAVSQVMVDKLTTLPRHKVSEPFGRLTLDQMRSVSKAILLVTGII